MAWIESHQELRNHPKRKRLSRLLGISRRETIGLLHEVWWWAYDYMPEGNLTALTDADIADAVDWEGDPGALVSALIESGFINPDRTLHDWWDYAQKWIERRRKDAERKRAGRSAPSSEAPPSEGNPPDVLGMSNHSPYVTGPDHTGPNLTGPDRPPKSSPNGEDLAAAAAATPNGAEGGRQSRRNGATAVAEPPSPDDEALWSLAVEQIAADDTGPVWRANVEDWIQPLVVAGRGPTGGLQLRAPPGAKAGAQRFRQVIAFALANAGDPNSKHVAIVE